MDSWATPPGYLLILPKLRILLLGSYHKKRGLPKLERLKDYLIQNDMNNCRVVKDFVSPPKMDDEPEDRYNLRKSRYWMRHADILIFVFFPDVDNASVGVELQYAVDKILGVTWRIILAYPQEHPPSLISGLGKEIEEFSVVEFSNEKELHEQVYGCIINLLHRFYDDVSNRTAGEWEYSSTSTDTTNTI